MPVEERVFLVAHIGTPLTTVITIRVITSALVDICRRCAIDDRGSGGAGGGSGGQYKPTSTQLNKWELVPSSDE